MIYTIEQENFSAFFDCPFEVYQNESNYISPFYDDLKKLLSHDKNPMAYKKYGTFTYFTCHHQDMLCGRIVDSIHTRSNEEFQLKDAHFGFFDCVNNLDVAKILLAAAEKWSKDQGCTRLLGNFNLTAMQQVGVMTSGFEHIPFIDQIYTPDYLPDLLKKCGYLSEFPMKTFEIDLKNTLPQLPPTAQNLLKDPNFKIQKIHRLNFKKYMSIACDLLNSGFVNNPMFVPLDYEEFWFQAKEMMWIIDPELTTISYYNNEPVGIVICIPDINPLIKACHSRFNLSSIYQFIKFKISKPERAVIIYYSVKPAFHNRNINKIMLTNLYQKLLEKNYKKLGCTWIADENTASIKQMQWLSAKEYHKLSLFKKEL